MTRRALLSMFALAAADPERLIWRPGRKLILIPPRPVPHRVARLAPVYGAFPDRLVCMATNYGIGFVAGTWRRERFTDIDGVLKKGE